MIEILTGDARILANQISDDSVDLVFSDPVWDRIEDYQWLAKVAARVLKPGGNCIAQVGNYYLGEVQNAMDPHLDRIRVLAEVFPFAFTRQWNVRVMQGWKPHVWFAKGKRNGQWMFDRFASSGKDKRYHKWGDNVSFTLFCIERLTNSGDLVFDPFVGSGTTAVACVQTNRRFIGYEINPKTADDARRRVARERLFAPQHEPVQLSIATIGLPRCKFCGTVLESNGGPGRRKEYCNDLCRLRAFRFRQKELKRNTETMEAGHDP